MKLLGSIFLTTRFFLLGGAVASLFFISYGVPILFLPAITLAILVATVTLYDLYLLYSTKTPVKGSRSINPIWSLGSETSVKYHLVNTTEFRIYATLSDELPAQFQARDHNVKLTLEKRKEQEVVIPLRPEMRGRYEFGQARLFISSSLRIVERRVNVAEPAVARVYPSIEQMKKLELNNFNKASTLTGVKKVRRLGNTQEFEQIKAYAIGDDQKRINWKSTGKRAEIMVNQYQEEKSQQVYCLIDKSRVMDFVSDGLSLLDHSINASLVLSNIALQKQDKAGLITYSSKPETFIKADRKPGQLKVLIEKLYRENESKFESNLELLYHTVRKNITQRSLLVFFTNFESSFALDRALPILRRLSKSHVLLVIFFENEEIRNFSKQTPQNLEGAYDQVIAEKYLFDKRQIQLKLRNYGIHAIVSRPDQLSVNAINKYLELKSRGVI